ncbi:hypothetical protein BGW41_005154 [Actinomortierella wolfii]|nr:hypothetical protein BGW41_005154 [Actinomortierella wolfii]
MTGCHVPFMALKRWAEVEYDQMKHEVEVFGRGDYAQLSRSDEGLIRTLVDSAVYEWLTHVRENLKPISKIDMERAAKGAYNIIIDCCRPGDLRPHRALSFTVSWRGRVSDTFEITHHKLIDEMAGLDDSGVEARMKQIHRIIKQYNYHPRDIFSLDEIGFYVQELSSFICTAPTLVCCALANRGARVSILLCVNADGSSLGCETEFEALRPFIICKGLNCWNGWVDIVLTAQQ